MRNTNTVRKFPAKYQQKPTKNNVFQNELPFPSIEYNINCQKNSYLVVNFEKYKIDP